MGEIFHKKIFFIPAGMRSSYKILPRQGKLYDTDGLKSKIKGHWQDFRAEEVNWGRSWNNNASKGFKFDFLVSVTNIGNLLLFVIFETKIILWQGCRSK